ncbi:large ribosomal subunit protein uL22m [Halyomorpha halys]|uniref:large ribosomal subunit protein uL22m n=1 Tax=Halyomorpha halys TaxID=286706 RepID=UPI0006D52544|nr:39S ribosomal protein L22, mitochondrial [Halyomorpha halys]
MNVLKKLFVPTLKVPHQLIGNALISQTRNISHISKAMPPLEEEGPGHPKKSKWLAHNDKIYPPQLPTEERRPAFVCHVKKNIKYSPKKMWYIACFVRGMSVDEALIQLNYVPKKGVLAVRQAILEAQQLAVENHNVEYRSNLWIAESFVGKGNYIKGVRRHAKGRLGEVEYKYCHYYVRLEEGKPPANYYNKPVMDKDTLLSKWIEEMRIRKVISSL